MMTPPFSRILCLVVVAMTVLALSGRAADVELRASDAFNATSFISGVTGASSQWRFVGGANTGFPIAGNDYFTRAFTLRTPALDAGNQTFQGDSLTVDGGGLSFKTTNSPTITVGNLILDGGTIFHHQAGSTFNLAGGLHIAAAGGTLNAQDGSIFVQSLLAGSGTLTITTATAGRNAVFSNAGNTFTGDISLVNSGGLTLTDTGKFAFTIGASGVNNSIFGDSSQTATFNGVFSFDLSGASAAAGSSWTIVDVGTLSETFGSTFAVADFTENDGVWSSGIYQFSEATGVLTVIPEPETAGMVVLGGLLAIAALRWRRKI